MVAETYVSGLNENISIYGLIAFMGKTNNKDNKLPLIKPEPKLKFNLKKDVYKKKEFKLRKVHTKTSFSTPRNNVLNFDIFCTKRNKTIGKKKSNPERNSRYCSHYWNAKFR